MSRPPLHVGAPTELGRYAAHGQPRLLIGQRLGTKVRVYDKPEQPNTGRSYLVESGNIESLAELNGLIAVYLQHAEAIDDIPMRAIRLDRDITNTATRLL